MRAYVSVFKALLLPSSYHASGRLLGTLLIYLSVRRIAVDQQGDLMPCWCSWSAPVNHRCAASLFRNCDDRITKIRSRCGDTDAYFVSATCKLISLVDLTITVSWSLTAVKSWSKVTFVARKVYVRNCSHFFYPVEKFKVRGMTFSIWQWDDQSARNATRDIHLSSVYSLSAA